MTVEEDTSHSSCKHGQHSRAFKHLHQLRDGRQASLLIWASSSSSCCYSAVLMPPHLIWQHVAQVHSQQPVANPLQHQGPIHLQQYIASHIDTQLQGSAANNPTKTFALFRFGWRLLQVPSMI